MKRNPVALFGVLAALGIPAGSGAQVSTLLHATPSPVDTGARVRLTLRASHQPSSLASSGDRMRGVLRGVSADTVHLELPGIPRPVAIPRHHVQRVEASLGPPSRKASIVESGTVGAMLMALRMLWSHQDPETRVYDQAWQAGAVGAAMGFAAGAYFGGRLPYERWRSARLPDRVR